MANIEFEHIDPWVDGQGDTGYSSRLKIRRNFEKIKAWIDSVTQQLSGKYLSKENDDEAAGKISFRAGSEWGPATGLWGWVKESYTRTVGAVTQTLKDGVAWFHWLLADRLEVSGIASFKSGVNVDGDLSVLGDASVGGDLNVGGTVFAPDGEFRNMTVGDTLETTNLRVTGSAYFWVLVFDKIRAAGGAWLITPVDGFAVEAVTTSASAFRLYWRADDGTKAIYSMWRVGMQAICKTMNAAEGTNYGLQNKYYWALVTGVSSPSTLVEIGGNKHHWIDISRVAGEYVGTLNPAVGDEIAMLGYRPQAGELDSDVEHLMSAIYIAAYESIDSTAPAPTVVIYSNINDFSLTGKRVGTMSPKLVEFLAERFRIVTTSGRSLPLSEYVEEMIPEQLPDGFSAWFEPASVVITEQTNRTGTTVTKSLDIVDGALLATVKAAHNNVSPDSIEISSLSYDTSVFGSRGPYIHSILKSVILFRGTDSVLSSTARKTVINVTFTASFGGQSFTFTRPLQVYITRLGSLYQETIGDITTTIRTREFWDESGRVIAFKSEVEDAANSFSRKLSEAVSGNLLLNTDFSQLVDGDFRLLHTVATMQWQGYRQWSHVRSGQWEKVLRHNQQHTVSFYARGTGRCGVIIHIYKVQADGTAVFTNTQYSKDFSLSAELTRFSYTFKPYPSTSSMRDTGGYAFCLMLGTVDTTSGEHWISHPQLELGASATTYTTGATNLLVNPELLTVRNGLPQGWDAWDNNDLYAPSTREVVTWMRPQFWARWKNAGELPRQLDILQDGELRYMRLKPKTYFDGLLQESQEKYGGTFKKELLHGLTYTVSFYARGTGNADCLLHIVKVGSTGQDEGAVAQPILRASLTSSWVRYSLTFVAEPDSSHSGMADADGYGFRLMIGCSHYLDDDTPLTETIEIARVQLEQGEVASAWHRGEENASVMASLFYQTARQLKLAVYKDEAQRAGIDIEYDEETDEGSVTLQGDKVVIDGDLDLQGLTTENVTPVARNPRYPTVINMGIVENGEDVVKSVQVVGDADSASTDIGNHIVVLPFYDEVNSKWTEKYSGITLNGDDTFNLYGDKKVVQWKKSGTKLSVTNSVIFRYRNWQENTDPNYANMLAGMVVVCSDGRVISKGNINSARPYNPSTDADGSLTPHPQIHAGLFSCGGYIARFIVLLPGQTLQLRSQIVLSDSRKVLVWVVENSTEFVPFFSSSKASKIEFVTYPDGSISGTLDYISNIASFNSTDHYHGNAETIMVPAAMNYRSDRVLVFSELYP